MTLPVIAPIHGTPYIGGQRPAILYVDASGLQRAVKVKLDAAVSPAVGDDSADGYAVGSHWLDTVAGVMWICADATEGAAVWIAAQGADGADGLDGAPGLDGDDGREVSLRNSGTAIEWQYTGDGTWTELVTIAAITGPQGAPGLDGADGANGLDGAPGAPGPNEVTAATATTLTGLLTGNGTNVGFTANNTSNWDTAHGWGNHAGANYATAAATIADNVVLRGDGGVRGVQASALVIGDVTADVAIVSLADNTDQLSFEAEPGNDRTGFLFGRPGGSALGAGYGSYTMFVRAPASGTYNHAAGFQSGKSNGEIVHFYNVDAAHVLRFNTTAAEELEIRASRASGADQLYATMGADPYMVIGGAAAARVGANVLTIVGSGEFTTGLTVGGTAVSLSGHTHAGVYEPAGAVATHAALTTGVHGLAITAGQTLTVTTGGTIGSAAYTASTDYAAAVHTHSYLANVSEDTTPQLGGDLDCNGHSVHFGTAENTQTPTGTTATIDLGAENHHTLDCGSATGAVTLTLTVPPGPTAGTIIVKQGATARDITWSPSSGTVTWLGTEPTWTGDSNKYRIVAWRWNASILFLSATETN